MPVITSPFVRRCAAGLLAVSVALALSSCVDAGAGPALPAESESPAPSGTTAPTTAPTAAGEPITMSCIELIDPNAVYAFDPNFASLDEWTPPAGSSAAEALAAGGIACELVRETGAVTIDVFAARLGGDSLDQKKSDAADQGEATSAYGDEAYFALDGDVGTATVFQGEYWLVMSSVAFASPEDPAGLIDSALSALAAL